jgi:hypothetical protein
LCYRIVVLGAILPNLFPGWVTSSATAITYTFGLNEDLYRYIAVGLLVTIGLIVTLSPVIYQSIEKIEMVLVSVILIFLLFAIFIATDFSVWTGVITKAPQGVADFPETLSTVGAATLLGAIAFAGAGGANNLVQSNYIRDKDLGTGARIPNIVSPITGEEEAAPGLGYTFPTNEENLNRCLVRRGSEFYSPECVEERFSQVRTYRVLGDTGHAWPVDRQPHVSSIRSVAAGTKGVNGG